MEKLLIKKIDENFFTLQNILTEKVYQLELTFFDFEEKLSEGDIIFMHKELLDPNYVEFAKHYYFGALNQPYGREITSSDNIDCIGLIIKDKKIALKRFFG